MWSSKRINLNEQNLPNPLEFPNNLTFIEIINSATQKKNLQRNSQIHFVTKIADQFQIKMIHCKESANISFFPYMEKSLFFV